MRLPRRSGSRDLASIDDRILPLINIVFLMLIFFIVAGVISPPRPFDVEPPQSAAEPAVENDALLIYVDAQGHYALDQERVAADGLPLAVSNRLRDNPGRQVRLVADGEADANELLEMLGALRAAGVDSVRITTRRAEPA